MRRAMLFAVIAFGAWGLTGCGSVTFVSGFPPASSLTTVQGFVSVIQPSVVFTSKQSSMHVTLVNFEAQFSGLVTSVTFCGNVSDRFVFGEFTSVDYTFTPGFQCATPVKITTS